MNPSRLALAALPLLAAATLAADASREADAWWAHVRFLADDGLEGRETGSAGHRRAAEYVAAAFERHGLEPAGTSGFYQPVPFTSRRIAEERSSIAVVRDGQAVAVTLGDDAYVNIRVTPAEAVDAPMHFVGYGLSIPDAGHDDLEGLDLTGAIAVYVTGGPSAVPGPRLADASSAARRWAALRSKGAIGSISIRNPLGADIPWNRAALARLRPALTLAEPRDGSGSADIALVWNAERADVLFAGAPLGAAEIVAAAGARRPLPRFALPGRLRATVATEVNSFESDNVAGLLRGSDADLRGEVIAVTAHLDHVGTGEPIAGDRIYNGAMDNASGIATLIETAAALKGRRLRRSVAFVAVTAEEHGLLGSQYFATHPSVEGPLVANLNTDMFLPLFPLRSVIAQGLEESDLADDLRRVGGALGVEVLSDPEPERNAFVRSDQYSFIRRGVPALSLKVGFAKDSPEHTMVRHWRRDRYHAPSDDLTQPVDLESAVRFNRLYAALVEAVANRDSRPSWYPTSAFRQASPE